MELREYATIARVNDGNNCYLFFLCIDMDMNNEYIILRVCYIRRHEGLDSR